MRSLSRYSRRVPDVLDIEFFRATVVILGEIRHVVDTSGLECPAQDSSIAYLESCVDEGDSFFVAPECEIGPL